MPGTFIFEKFGPEEWKRLTLEEVFDYLEPNQMVLTKVCTEKGGGMIGAVLIIKGEQAAKDVLQRLPLIPEEMDLH